MKWLTALDVALSIGAVVLFFTGFGVLALICIILAALLSLILSGGKFDLLFDIFD